MKQPEAKRSSLEGQTTLALLLEYEGSRYNGSQLQFSAPTIQAELERAIFSLTGEKIRIKAASRTDAGVHARGQVMAFKTESRLEPEVFLKGLNHYLPTDIAVKAACRVEEDFDPRRRALSRSYRYCILNSEAPSPLRQAQSYRVSVRLDVEAMNEACQALLGEQDFSSFASDMAKVKKNPVRRVYEAVAERENDTVIFKITANSFLPHQVRNTVGALLQVGQGRMTPDEFKGIIKARKFGLAGPAVPASGLCLDKVSYGRGVLEWETG